MKAEAVFMAFWIAMLGVAATVGNLSRGGPMQIEVRSFPVPMPQPNGLTPAVQVPLGAKVSHLEITDGFHNVRLVALVDPSIDALETVRVLYLAHGVPGEAQAEWGKLEPLRMQPPVPGWSAVLQRE